MNTDTILILGGTADSRELAKNLIGSGRKLIYSVAGLVRQPNLDCEVHSGGFSNGEVDGAEGLAAFAIEKGVCLIIDATHPYAAEISANAVAAAEMTNIQCWRLDRSGWDPNHYPLWHDYEDLESLIPLLQTFSRPFLSVGISALKVAHLRPDHQTWVVRSARPFADQSGIVQINAIGPFTLQEELKLMENNRIDVLVAKNSGCSGVEAKMKAARKLELPVYVQRRPNLAPATRSFGTVRDMVDAIETVSQAR